jgi:UDP-glucose:glycoprotein glucosyltransferase
MTFSVDSQVASGPGAFFKDMPSKPVLTVGMDPPESWLVESVRTQYDLDNIHLEEVDDRGVDADFELEYLLLEGLPIIIHFSHTVEHLNTTLQSLVM